MLLGCSGLPRTALKALTVPAADCQCWPLPLYYTALSQHLLLKKVTLRQIPLAVVLSVSCLGTGLNQSTCAIQKACSKSIALLWDLLGNLVQRLRQTQTGGHHFHICDALIACGSSLMPVPTLITRTAV